MICIYAINKPDVSFFRLTDHRFYISHPKEGKKNYIVFATNLMMEGKYYFPTNLAFT